MPHGTHKCITLVYVSLIYELKKKIRKVLTSKSVGNGPSSYEKIIYLAAISQRLRNTGLGSSMLRVNGHLFDSHQTDHFVSDVTC